MNRRTDKKAYLVLSDGSIFRGWSFGAECDSVGELVFTTGMGGYVETLTDPSYYGQIIMQTFPLIGNYGIMEEDFEGNAAAAATWSENTAIHLQISDVTRIWIHI